MRRFHVHPYSVSIRPARLLSLVLVVAVLWVLYERFRDPATWKTLLDLKDDVPVAAVPAEPALSSSKEAVVAGPNDLDEAEVADAQQVFQLVNDRTPLRAREMHAYWRLMTWSRTMSSTELQQRALQDVPFTQLWEQPEKYRGKPITLRLHVRRVLKYDAPTNPQELPVTYEAWGWTDESRSFPYVVVFPECPEGLPVGTDIRGEVVFVGYFLKIMSYNAFDTARGAPLLVGRVQVIPPKVIPAVAPPNPKLLIGILTVGAVLAAIGVWTQLRSRCVVRTQSLPDEAVLIGPASLPVIGDNAERKPQPRQHPELDLLSVDPHPESVDHVSMR